MHIRNSHVFVHSLAHVVDSEQCNSHAGERFHLDAGLCNRPGSASHFGVALQRHNVDLNFAQRQSVAKRNEMRSPFGGLNPSNPRGRKDIALRDLISRNEIERFAPELDFALSDRSARTQRFGREGQKPCDGGL